MKKKYNPGNISLSQRIKNLANKDEESLRQLSLETRIPLQIIIKTAKLNDNSK